MMGRRLKLARQKAGISQKQLALRIGVEPAEISQYESGKRTPRWGVFIKILDELKVSSDYMLERDIKVVSDDEEYQIKLSKLDIEIIKEIKNNPKLYKKLLSDTQNNVKKISDSLNEIF